MSAALLLQRGSGFLLYVLIARHLGILAFGQFSLVYTFFLIFQIPAMFGLGNLLVREVAKNRRDYVRYLTNGHLIVTVSALASLVLWVLFVNLFGYTPEIVRSSYLLSLALVPFAMSVVCEAIFKAFERMHFVVYAFAAANLAKIGLVWYLLSHDHGLLDVIGLLVIIQVFMLMLEWFFILRFFPVGRWTVDFKFSWKLARSSATFLGMAIFTMLFMRLNIIILSKFRGELEVGLYNAAFQLTYAFMLVSLSLKDAVYPVLSRIYTTNLDRFRRYTERSIQFLISLGLFLAVFLFFQASDIMTIYKEEFVAAVPVLKILAWLLIPLSFDRIFGGVLQASGHQRANLIILVINAVNLLILSIVFIYLYGLIGAGVAFLVCHVTSFILHYAVISKKIFRISVYKIIWKPALAGVVLVLFWLLVGDRHGFFILSGIGALLYVTILFSLTVLFGNSLNRTYRWHTVERVKQLFHKERSQPK